MRPGACALCNADPGDYNRDGLVNAADYALWRRQYGVQGDALADGNGDGSVDAADYTVWRDAVSNEAAALTLPSPSAWALCLAPLLCAGFSRRR